MFEYLNKDNAPAESLPQTDDSLKTYGFSPKLHAVLGNLASEMVVDAVNLSLGTFPAAIKAVTPLIDAGKIEEAKVALSTALGILVEVRSVIHLPLLRTELLLADAELPSQKECRRDAESQALVVQLSQARYQLKIAEALGYGHKKDYKEYYRLMDEIKDKTRDGKFGQGFFNKTKEKLTALKDEAKKETGSK